jgi:hypothetical protein
MRCVLSLRSIARLLGSRRPEGYLRPPERATVKGAKHARAPTCSTFRRCRLRRKDRLEVNLALVGGQHAKQQYRNEAAEERRRARSNQERERTGRVGCRKYTDHQDRDRQPPPRRRVVTHYLLERVPFRHVRMVRAERIGAQCDRSHSRNEVTAAGRTVTLRHA